jgi:hypothetical protein
VGNRISTGKRARPGRGARRAAVVLALLATLAGCGSLPGWVDPGLEATGAPSGRKLLLYAPEVHMYEISAGGVPEKVYVWGDAARDAVLDSVRVELGRIGALELADVPELDSGERVLLERHAAMFRRVGDQIAAVKEINDPLWKAREKELEFTVGSGLSGLAERTGAETILFVDGIDYVSSPGRRAVAALTMLVFVLPVILPGSSYLQAGLVDLRSGRVLWFGRDYSLTLGDLREGERASRLVRSIFASFPGAPTAGAGAR